MDLTSLDTAGDLSLPVRMKVVMGSKPVTLAHIRAMMAMAISLATAEIKLNSWATVQITQPLRLARILINSPHPVMMRHRSITKQALLQQDGSRRHRCSHSRLAMIKVVLMGSKHRQRP